jgi:hypothetical protein
MSATFVVVVSEVAKNTHAHMTKNFALVILVLEMAKMGEKPPRRT